MPYWLVKGVNGQELSHRHELSDKVATHSADNSPTGVIQGFMNGVFGGLVSDGFGKVQWSLVAMAHPGSSARNWPPLPQSFSVQWPLHRDYEQTLSKWSRDSPLTIKTHLPHPTTPNCFALLQSSSRTHTPSSNPSLLLSLSFSLLYQSIFLSIWSQRESLGLSLSTQK